MKELGIKNIITGIFVIAAVAALMVFSGVIKIGTNSQEAQGSITIWGTIESSVMAPYLSETTGGSINVSYEQKNPASYESDLINAFASGVGPDVFIMSHEYILRHTDKILEIPYSSLPRNSYESTYVDEGKLFLTDTGIMAFPLSIDPLVMYYNKPLISSAFILDIPQYWDEFIAFNPKITEYNGTGEISISAVSMGSYDNVRNAKGLISALILQNGNTIVGTDPKDSSKFSLLRANTTTRTAAVPALDFYTSFSRFGSDTYSWNEALIDSQSKFIAGEVAVYFGRASEVENIRKKNPNLDFGVELFPQVRASKTRLTQGDMLGVSVSKQTKNIPAALSVASSLAGPQVAGNLAEDLRVAPARKDLLRDVPDDALRTLVYKSAIISAGWIDPAPERTHQLMRTLITNINTGALSTQDAIDRANADLNTILDQTINLTVKRER